MMNTSHISILQGDVFGNAEGLERALASDREFFDNNPQAISRVRDFVFGEGTLCIPPGHRAMVSVTQLAPGMRIRQPFFVKIGEEQS
jgi:hypothetical protein